ncbi:Uncharacterised protein [Vibrio cholerae]|nr:Uncharacterised protein [Vibrio cholerae]CSI75155.1 Uncharacterised protein [Vibrio cholerae]
MNVFTQRFRSPTSSSIVAIWVTKSDLCDALHSTALQRHLIQTVESGCGCQYQKPCEQ